MSDPDINFEQLSKDLEESADYRVLRRLRPRQAVDAVAKEATKQAILLDVETTGLDTASDEIVELGMVKFSYDSSGRVGSVIDTFSSLNEPTKPIPEEAIKQHGLTDAMVAGHKIDPAAVDAFVCDAAIIIAHNAGFDRKFAERYWPVFASKHWACSISEVGWRDHGFEGSRLGYLLNGIGLFHWPQAAAPSVSNAQRKNFEDCNMHSPPQDQYRSLPTQGPELGPTSHRNV